VQGGETGTSPFMNALLGVASVLRCTLQAWTGVREWNSSGSPLSGPAWLSRQYLAN
jgi:hypothetical protein